MKSATTKVASNLTSAIRILKTGICPSLSGKSKLTYQIGSAGKADIQFRISGNDAAGYFNDDWVALADIQEVLDKVPSGEAITSFVLVPLFRGKSMNTPGFLFAALKGEGLVERSKDKQRCYQLGDLKSFMASVKALSDLGGDPEGKRKQAALTKAAVPTKKTPTKPTAKKKA